MTARTAGITLVCLLLPVGAVMALESELSKVFLDSVLAREAAVSYQIEELEARALGQYNVPVLYLAAPAACSITLPPGGRYANQTRLGIRGPLPYGAAGDISWNHSLDYLKDVDDPAGVPQNGFIQSFSAQADITIPIYNNGSSFISSSIALNARQQAGARLAIARNQLARDYVQDWFSLYRTQLSVEVLALHAQIAEMAVQAYEQLVTAGDATLYELWQTQRKLNAAELEHLQADIELKRLKARFLSRYGIQFPEQTDIPTGSFDWSRYDVYPLMSAEESLTGLVHEASQLHYRRERSEMASQFIMGFSLNSPALGEAKSFRESITDQFAKFEDWSLSLTLGISLSTDDVRSTSIQKVRYELNSEGLSLQRNRRREELQTDVQQLRRLQTHYQQMLERELRTAARMQNYIDDMQRLHAAGEVDLLKLNESRLQQEEIKLSARTTEARLVEVQILLQL